MLAFLSINPLLNSKLQEGTPQMPLHELGADHRQTRILRTHPEKTPFWSTKKCASKFPKKQKKLPDTLSSHQKKSKYTSNKLTSTFPYKTPKLKGAGFFFKKTSRFQALSKKRRAKVIHLHLRKSQGTSA